MVALLVAQASALGCDHDACPTGTTPSETGCVAMATPDAGVDAQAVDASMQVDAFMPDAFTPDAFMPDAFLVVPDGCVPLEYWNDNDGDGFGDRAMAPIVACTPPATYVTNDDDCDDSIGAVSPMGTEVCNGIDDNCNGDTDEALRVMLHRDADMDGYGTSVTSAECPGTAGWAAITGDCNDMSDAVNPMRAEACNGIDDNCDGGIDEMLLSVFYQDVDMDGYGVSPSAPLCAAPPGYATRAGDCNDMDENIAPGLDEVCNGIDDNCNAAPDETFACVRGRSYSCGTTCGTTGSYVCPAGCAIPACGPPAESCNGNDDDCDAYIDEGVNTWTGPTNAATSNLRVELLATSGGFVRVLARSGGIYARTFDRRGLAIGAETQLTTTLPALFAATIRDNALFVATFASNTLTGYRFDASTLTSMATPVASYLDNTVRLRIIANDDRLFIVTDTGGKLDLRVRGRGWEGTGVQRVADGPVDFDLALASDPSRVYIAIALPNAVDLMQTDSSASITRLFRHATSAGTRFANVAIGQTNRGSDAVGILFHDNAGLASNVHFVLFSVESVASVSPIGELTLEVITPSSTPLDGAMDLAFSGGRFTASWLTSSGTQWQIGDIRPNPGTPTATLSTIALGAPTTSLALASGTSGTMMALHAQAGTAAARTWFRGCP